MNPKWQLCGRIPPGGTVLHLSCTGDGTLFAASPAGLFARQDENWRPVIRGFPFGSTSVTLAVQKSLFVAGYPHGLVRSFDQGKTWHKCWTEQTEAPITCLVPSPNYNRDRVVLAGTDGDGILRSTDGGRFWRLENFGLRSFSVLAMAVAPVWGRREVLFAGTEAGFFQSPNGGRAWRQIGEKLGDKKVTAILVSPHFNEDQTIFAGTEENGLYRSVDGGWHWSPVALPPVHPKSINCLQLIGQTELLIGTGTDGILKAKIDGSACKQVAQIPAPVFCFTESDDQLSAGISEEGLLRSTDRGETWTPDPDLNARHFNWLAAVDEKKLLAAGISEGLWISSDGGAHWRQAADEVQELIPLDIAISHPDFWVGAADGIWVSRDVGGTWVQAHASDIPISTIACATHRVWAGTHSGQLWTSENDGQTWQPSEIPIGPATLIAFTASTKFDEDQTLVAAAADNFNNRFRLWRSTDAGESWHLWFDEKTDWEAVRLALNGLQGEAAILGLGTKIFWRSAGDWQAKEITTNEAPITALLSTPDPQQMLAAVTDDLLGSKDGVTWEEFSQGMEGASIVSLQPSPNFTNDLTVWGLTREGNVWKRVFPKK